MKTMIQASTLNALILGLSSDKLSVKINKIERFDLTLPTNPEFAKRDLCEDLSAKTAAVEGVKK